MDIGLKKALACTGDSGLEATAKRLRAAFGTTGLRQNVLAEIVGKGPASINNQLKGLQFPSRDLALYLYEQHRIDFNFLYLGSFSQLPMDVQDRLFEELIAKR